MRRILVVDDDHSICKALQLGLTAKEVEVDIADNGESGVELGARNRYDAVIADMILPGMNGIEVIQGIRRGSPDVVSILITGNPGKTVLAESARHGVTTYLEKPVDMKTIKEAINRGLEERALERYSAQAAGGEGAGLIRQEGEFTGASQEGGPSKGIVG